RAAGGRRPLLAVSGWVVRPRDQREHAGAAERPRTGGRARRAAPGLAAFGPGGGGDDEGAEQPAGTLGLPGGRREARSVARRGGGSAFGALWLRRDSFRGGHPVRRVECGHLRGAGEPSEVFFAGE